MLLFSSDFTDELKQAIDNSTDKLVICSAFIKSNAIKNLLENISNQVSVSIIVRWAKHDLVFGASDLEVFNWCDSKGYRFGVNTELHAKLYAIDSQTIFLGSANLTLRGLSISGAGNVEIGTCLEPEVADLVKLSEFIEQEVEWLDQSLYEAMASEVEVSKKSSTKEDKQNWSEGIKGRLQKDVKYLWLHDLLFTSPAELIRLDFDDEQAVHDFELLKLDLSSLDTDALKAGFIQSRLFLWIKCCVGYNNEVRFGWLTNELHNALLDDTTPYRREVKDFIVTLFDWFKFMPELFEVKKYNHSETVILKK